MNSVTLKSPAKVNLFLHVHSKRSDGYHNLVTVFHRLSLADTLTLKKRKSGFSLKTNAPKLPVGESNLITRAYRELQKIFPKLGGVDVRLRKCIPIAGGLGGGSSNAATFLLGMKRLYRLPMASAALARIGARLGADIPFFLLNQNNAVATGIGERLQARPLKRKLWFLLAVSGGKLSTREVYSRVRVPKPAVSLTKLTRAVTILCDFFEQGKTARAASLMLNDLEVPATRLRPSLRKVFKRFHTLGVTTARLSGSGPTVFAIFPDARSARRLRDEWRKKFPARGKRRSSAGDLILSSTY